MCGDEAGYAESGAPYGRFGRDFFLKKSPGSRSSPSLHQGKSEITTVCVPTVRMIVFRGSILGSPSLGKRPNEDSHFENLSCDCSRLSPALVALGFVWMGVKRQTSSLLQACMWEATQQLSSLQGMIDETMCGTPLQSSSVILRVCPGSTLALLNMGWT